MADVFISYAGEDREVVLPVAAALEAAGFSTWYYQRDCPAFRRHLESTSEAISQAQAVALIISEHSLASHEVDSEVEWAHRNTKPIAPILVDMEWAALETKRPAWCRIIGTGVGISIRRDHVQESIPRIVAGLVALGLTPTGQPPDDQKPTRLYPYLLAAILPPQGETTSPDEAFRIHRSFGDIVEAMVKYVTTIVIAYYRKNMIRPGSEDPQVEQQLKGLAQPSLEHWVGVLDFILNKYRESSDPIIAALVDFYFERTHQDDALAKAILRMQEWLGLRPRLRPPFAYRDLIDSALLYGDAAEGWASGSATMPEKKYQARIEVLRPALEQMIEDLLFLTGYPLVCIGPDGQPHDAMGDAITPRTEPLRDQTRLEAGHLYLCSYDPCGADPLLDLSPLLIGTLCPQCNDLRLFALGSSWGRPAEYRSPTCGHAIMLAADRQRTKDLGVYLSAAYWQQKWSQPAPTFEPRPEHQPYLDELRALLPKKEVTPADRDYLESLAAMLSLSPEVQRQLEEIVRLELAAAQAAPGGWTISEVPQPGSEPSQLTPGARPTPIVPGPEPGFGASEGAGPLVEQILGAARARAAKLGIGGIDSTLLFAAMLEQKEGATVQALHRLGLSAGMFRQLLGQLETELAALRQTATAGEPILSASVRDIVKSAQDLAQGAAAGVAREVHLLEAFVLHRRSSMMRLLSELGIDPERLIPGPFMSDDALDESRFAPKVLELLREALRHAQTSRILGSPQILAAVATHGSEAARQKLAIPADNIPDYVQKLLEQAMTYPDRPQPVSVTRSICSTRAERILNLADLLARAARNPIQEKDFIEAIVRCR